MKTNQLIKSFAKGVSRKSDAKKTQNAVIYTRVSTKEQADTNQSLDTESIAWNMR
jgi:hypothetical protein